MATAKKTEETISKSFEEMTIEEKKAYMEEPVEIELFYDGSKYKDDVHIQINDQDWLIVRGERVTVPRKVAELIKNNEEQRAEALRNQRGLTSKFSNEANKFIG